MLTFLGWSLILLGFALLLSSRTTRARAWPGVAALVLGLILALGSERVLATPHPVELRQDLWVINPATGPAAPIRWEGDSVVATLAAGSGHYAAFPIDWRNDHNGRLDASWEITFVRFDRPGDPLTLLLDGRTVTRRRGARDLASLAVGLLDQTAASIDDRDHVSGSGLQACFSDDIRLRVSDSSYLLRTASATESGGKEPPAHFHAESPVTLRLQHPYHCNLRYDRNPAEAVLEVNDDRGPVVTRRVRDVREFTGKLSWFGVTVRGYERFDKRLDPAKGTTGYTRPAVQVRIRNLTIKY